MSGESDSHEDALLRAAAEAADGRSGRTEANIDESQQRVLRNLGRLASLREAFRRLDGAGERSAAEDTPLQWGHLSVLGEIGRGGFGVVYRAFDPVLQREVALKLQRGDGDAALAAGWIEEARRLARVRHPHVLAVHGAGVNDSRVGLWSDLIDGVSLAQSLRHDGRWSRRSVLGLARQLTSALAAVHEAGLTHGDIKPENVLLDGGQAILMDFGAAAHQGALPRFGTPASMAPELLDGGRSSSASDIYSLGVLLCCAALDRDPRGVTDSTGLRGDLRRSLGRPLQRLLLRMLDPRPGQRPSAAAALVELDRIESLPRRRARAIAVALVLASLAAALGASLMALERTRAERDRSARMKDFLVEGLMQASPLRANRPASAMEVLEFLEVGLDRRLSGIDDARAEMRLVLGEAFMQFGQIERGLEMIERAVSEFRSAPRARPRDLANALISLAIVRRRHGDIEGALAAADEAGRQLDRLGRTRAVELSRVKLEALRGNIFNGLGRPLEALQAHRRTANLRATAVGRDDPQLAVDFNNIGAAALRAGLYREAEAAYLEAARRLAAAGRGDSGPMAMVQLGLAHSLVEQGDAIERSREHQQEALRLYRSNYPEGHPGPWSAEAMAARILRGAGRLDAAELAYRSLLERAPEDPALRAVVQFQLGLVLFEQGRMDDAREHFLACAEMSADEPDPRASVARVGVALADWQAGRRERPLAEELDALIAALAASDYAQRSEVSLLRRWREMLR